SAATDRRVFLDGVLPLYRWQRKVEIELAVRPVALLARVGRDTALRSLRRLVHERGVLDCTHPHVRGSEEAAVYRLADPRCFTSSTERVLERPSQIPGREVATSDLVVLGLVPRAGRDVFRRGGGALGWLAGDVYVLLRERVGLSVPDLATALG